MRPLLLLLLLLTGCDVLGPSVAIEPAPEWREWYGHVQECAGQQGPPFDLITFYEAEIEGSWVGLARGWRVYLEPDWHREGVIKHELLHVIGYRHPDDAEHPYPWPFEPCSMWRP